MPASAPAPATTAGAATVGRAAERDDGERRRRRPRRATAPAQNGRALRAVRHRARRRARRGGCRGRLSSTSVRNADGEHAAEQRPPHRRRARRRRRTGRRRANAAAPATTAWASSSRAAAAVSATGRGPRTGRTGTPCTRPSPRGEQPPSGAASTCSDARRAGEPGDEPRRGDARAYTASTTRPVHEPGRASCGRVRR